MMCEVDSSSRLVLPSNGVASHKCYSARCHCFVGVRILDGPVTDSLEASALLYQNQLVDIYSASWGPRDNGETMEGPGKHCIDALKKGAEEVRELSSHLSYP